MKTKIAVIGMIALALVIGTVSHNQELAKRGHHKTDPSSEVAKRSHKTPPDMLAKRGGHKKGSTVEPC